MKTFGIGILDVKNASATTHYKKWSGMLYRAMCHNSYNRDNVTASISEEFLIFSKFRDWMNTHNWKNKLLCREIFGMHNYLYSADTCLFVTKEVASAVRYVGQTNNVGCQPCDYSSGFKARIHENNKLRWLGTYKTMDLAQAAYYSAKADSLLRLANKDDDLLVKRQLFSLAHDYKTESNRLKG